MWSGGHHNPRNPPPYYLPPTNPPYGATYPNAPLYPNPNPDANVPVLSHSGVPSPNSSAQGNYGPTAQNYGPAGQNYGLAGQNYGPPAYGIHQPPAGAVNYQSNPYQPQPVSGDDMWIPVNHNSTIPPGLVQAMDRPLNNNDNSAKNSFIALWNNNGEPVYGRARDNNGRIEAWFPYGGKEHHSGSINQAFSVLTYSGPPRQNFRYAWVPVNQLNSMCQPVRQQDYVAAVIPDLRIGSFHGEMLGKANMARQMAWVSHGGQEHHFTDDKYRNSFILCRVPL